MNIEKNMQKESTSKTYMKCYAIVMLTMLVMSMLGILLLAWLLYKFHISEKALSIGIVVIYILTNFTGGFITGKSLKKRKYMWGLLAGLLYYLILILLATIFGHYVGIFSTKGLTALFICIGSAMLGGMFG